MKSRVSLCPALYGLPTIKMNGGREGSNPAGLPRQRTPQGCLRLDDANAGSVLHHSLTFGRRAAQPVAPVTRPWPRRRPPRGIVRLNASFRPLCDQLRPIHACVSTACTADPSPRYGDVPTSQRLVRSVRPRIHSPRASYPAGGLSPSRASCVDGEGIMHSFGAACPGTGPEWLIGRSPFG